MMTIESETLIHRPMDDVIDCMIGTPRAINLDPQVMRRPRGESVVAAHVPFDFYEHYGSGPLAQLVRRTTSRTVCVTTIWTFTTVADGTRLQVHIEIEPLGLPRFLGPFIGTLMRPGMQRRSAWALATVKQVMEGQLGMPNLLHLSETSSRP
jgi:hypothetical protein